MRGVFFASILFTALSSTLAARAAEPERVRIPAVGITLAGVVYRPAGTGPFPAVVALHGCAGLTGRDGKIMPREEDWAQKLVAEGFVVLLPDSYSPRGLVSQCRVRERKVRASRERRDDAHAARRWLQQQAYVKHNAVSLLGWSNGATGVLYAMRAERPTRPGRRFRVVGTDFAKAVAFYPGCRTLLDAGDFKPRAPLLVLMGQADDWTPAKPCEAMVSRAKTLGGDATFVGYPGAYHDFDVPDRPVTVLKGLAFTGAGTGGDAHTGTDPAARADALKRVPQFLAR